MRLKCCYKCILQTRLQHEGSCSTPPLKKMRGGGCREGGVKRWRQGGGGICWFLLLCCCFFLSSCIFRCIRTFQRLILLLETFGIIQALGLTRCIRAGSRHTFAQRGIKKRNLIKYQKQAPLHLTVVCCRQSRTLAKSSGGKHRCHGGLGCGFCCAGLVVS